MRYAEGMTYAASFMKQIRVSTISVALVFMLAACTSPSPTRGLTDVKSLVDARDDGHYDWMAWDAANDAVDQRVESLLGKPLSLDAAVQVALLRNPRLQIDYARLGIAQADLLEASRLTNPTLSAAVLQPVTGAVAALGTGGLVQSFSDLVLLRARERLSRADYERSQFAVAAAIFELCADVRVAWYAAVGAQEVADLRARIAAAAQTAALLARQFHDAGNGSVLELNLQLAAATQARLAATRANADATRAHAALRTVLGLSHQEDHWTLPPRLPLPVPEEDAAEQMVELAQSQRLDLLAARREVAIGELSLKTTQEYRWMGRVDVGLDAERDTDRSRLLGPSLTLQLPIFNQGQGAVARAQALLVERRARLKSLELAIDVDVRLDLDRVQAARAIVEDYRSALLPQRDAVLRASQENANYMLIGTLDLLLVKQQQYDAAQAFVEAIRDYWLARVDLMRTVGARLPSESRAQSMPPPIEGVLP